jgi:catechol 2,3-dioxygenase-like lactoylglutathione lyase family enzyme
LLSDSFLNWYVGLHSLFHPGVYIMTAEVSQGVRFHISLNVADLSRSVHFFKTLFGTEPAKQRADYAKFELSDPPLVLSLEPHAPASRGALNHAGFRFPNSAALVDAQRRLEVAGFNTQREEGVECCYAKQTKFWVNDPDGGLWEFYVLEGDIEHRGAGQSADNLLPQVASCGPVCGGQSPQTAVYEHRMGDPFSLAGIDDGALGEIRLRGTFNLAEYGSQIPDVLADARRALQPGGKLHIHVLTSDRPLADEELSLPGPAARVKHVPVDAELFQALEESNFTNVTLTTFRSAPCFRIGETELRETMVDCQKPVSEPCQSQHAGEDRVVMYKGPHAAVTDDGDRTFPRGHRVTIPLAAWESLQRTPLAAQFVCFDLPTASPAVCGVH